MEPVRIEFMSEGACVSGRFFPAAGAPAATVLLVPGWPGNADDVLGLGEALSGRGINVCMFNPRGLHQSEGTASFPNTLQDIGAAWYWLGQADVQRRLGVDPIRLALGGYSYGGGMAMAYAARDSGVRRLISIAGNDHGEFIRACKRNATFAEAVRAYLLSTRAPQGPARFDPEAVLQELAEHQEVYGLRENAANLADRTVLLIGGWEDVEVSVEQILLPLYRALKRAGAADLTFLVYHDDHSYSTVRERLASDIRSWLLRTEAP
jgi:pimeloyl-ACP methyl ester carboxylesterase